MERHQHSIWEVLLGRWTVLMVGVMLVQEFFPGQAFPSSTTVILCSLMKGLRLQDVKEIAPMVILFSFGSDFKGAMKAYFDISGHTPVIPLFM